MRCATCGKDNPKDAAFCGQCGAKLEPASKANDVPALSTHANAGTHKPWLAIGTIVLLIAVIGGGAWWHQHERDRKVFAGAAGLVNITSGQITDIGAAKAVAINNAGQVIACHAPSERYFHGFIWQDGHVTDSPSIPVTMGNGSVDHEPGETIAVNNQGEILLMSLGNIGYLWKDGQVTNLDQLPSYPAKHRYPIAIGDNGQILSNRDSVDGPPFIWQDGHVVDLVNMSNTLGEAEAINNKNQVVGDKEGHAVIWENNQVTNLSSLGGDSSAVAINNLGQTVGNSAMGTKTSGDNVTHACLWQDGKVTDLGTLPGFKNSSAVWINNNGQIVGISSNDNVAYDTPNRRTFLWQNGHMIDLNSLLPHSSGWVLEDAESINDKGQIVGNGKHNGQPRAFLLTPK